MQPTVPQYYNLKHLRNQRFLKFAFFLFLKYNWSTLNLIISVIQRRILAFTVDFGFQQSIFSKSFLSFAAFSWIYSVEWNECQRIIRQNGSLNLQAKQIYSDKVIYYKVTNCVESTKTLLPSSVHLVTFFVASGNAWFTLFQFWVAQMPN